MRSHNVSTFASPSNDIDEVAGTGRGTIEVDTIIIILAIGGKSGSRLNKSVEIWDASHVEEGDVSVGRTSVVITRSCTSAEKIADTNSEGGVGDDNPNKGGKKSKNNKKN